MLYDCVAYMRFDRPLNPLRHLRVGGIGIRAEKYITLLPPPLPTLKTATENGEGEGESAALHG